MNRDCLRSLRKSFPIGSFIAVILVAVPLSSQETNPAEESQTPKPVEMNEREQAFAKAMSGVTLAGNFTVTGRDEGGLPKLTAENYQLGEVRKVADGKWLIPARIKYGDKDVTLPLTLPVEWAGDTAVIIVDNIGFPGLGTYSARVLIHDGRYAGYWAGVDHGGHLFGELKKPEK